MPKSTVVIFGIWTVFIFLSRTELGVFLGLLFGFVVAMLIFPIGFAISQALPWVAQAYSDAAGPLYELLLPIGALLTLGVVLAAWGYVRYNNSGRGTALMNLGVSLAGVMTVVLVSDSALGNSGFGN